MHSNREHFWVGFEKKATSFSKLASSGPLKEKARKALEKSRTFGKGALMGAGAMWLVDSMRNAANQSAFHQTR